MITQNLNTQSFSADSQTSNTDTQSSSTDTHSSSTDTESTYTQSSSKDTQSYDTENTNNLGGRLPLGRKKRSPGGGGGGPPAPPTMDCNKYISPVSQDIETSFVNLMMSLPEKTRKIIGHSFGRTGFIHSCVFKGGNCSDEM